MNIITLLKLLLFEKKKNWESGVVIYNTYGERETVSPRNDTATIRSKIPIQYYSNVIRTIKIILYSYERGQRQSTQWRVTLSDFAPEMATERIFSRRRLVSNDNVYSCTVLDGNDTQKSNDFPIVRRTCTTTAMTCSESPRKTAIMMSIEYAASRGQNDKYTKNE